MFLAGSALLLVVATVTPTVWVRHYYSAPGLEFDGGAYGWVGVDGSRSTDVSIGTFDILRTPLRPNRSQTFSFWVYNPSTVTQTILGLRYPGTETTEPSHVVVSTSDPGQQVGDDDLAYKHGPVAVPPHRYRTIRYTVGNRACWDQGRSDTWTDVALRVRIGAFTRNEDISFGGQLGFVVTATHATC